MPGYKYEYTMGSWADNGAKSAPSESLRSTGFVGGMKPPASVFNYWWDRQARAISELQQKAVTSANPVVSISAINGSTYVGTVDGVTELYAGLTLVVIPSMSSTTKTPQLNINSLGYMPILVRADGISTENTTFYDNWNLEKDWLSADVPVQIMYDGSSWIADFRTVDAEHLHGAVPPANGGTGLKKVTAGSYLVGNGTGAMTEKTPAEVLQDIGGAKIASGKISATLKDTSTETRTYTDTITLPFVPISGTFSVSISGDKINDAYDVSMVYGDSTTRSSQGVTSGGYGTIQVTIGLSNTIEVTFYLSGSDTSSLSTDVNVSYIIYG